MFFSLYLNRYIHPQIIPIVATVQIPPPQYLHHPQVRTCCYRSRSKCLVSRSNILFQGHQFFFGINFTWLYKTHISGGDFIKIQLINVLYICNMREISKYIFSVSCDAEELLSVLGSSSQWQRPSTQTSTSPHFEGGNPLHSLVSPPTTAPVTPLTPLCTLVCWFCLHVVETLVYIFSQ